MNNSVFRKTMENVRKQKDVKLVTRWEGRYRAKSLIASPNFHSCIVFDNDDMVIIEMNRNKVINRKKIESYDSISLYTLVSPFSIRLRYLYTISIMIM